MPYNQNYILSFCVNLRIVIFIPLYVTYLSIYLSINLSILLHANRQILQNNVTSGNDYYFLGMGNGHAWFAPFGNDTWTVVETDLNTGAAINTYANPGENVCQM